MYFQFSFEFTLKNIFILISQFISFLKYFYLVWILIPVLVILATYFQF